MKRVTKVLGVAVLAALVGFTMAACDTGSPAAPGGGGGFLTVGATDGRLTITGLEAHDDRRVIAFGVFGAYGDEFIAAAQSISIHAVYTGGMIADGTVELNVWASVDDYNNPGYTNFDGTGTAHFFQILVINRAPIGEGELDAIGEYFEGGPRPEWLMDYSFYASVDFYYGIGSMLWSSNGGNNIGPGDPDYDYNGGNGENGNGDDPGLPGTTGLIFGSVAGGYAVTGFEGTETEIVIPAVHNGQAVVSIGNNALSNRQLTSVTIPDSVTSIGNNAFQNNQLTSATIGSGVTSIGWGAFVNNPLTSLTVGMAAIGADLFNPNGIFRAINTPLTSVTIGMATIGANLFNPNGGLSSAINTPLTSVTLLDSVTSIGTSAFANNSMTTVVIPQSVRTIANNAFQGNAINDVTIGSGVAIGNNASMGNHGTPFLTAYNNGGMLAGRYTWTPGFLGIGQGSWTRQP